MIREKKYTEEINLLEYVQILLKWKNMIIGIVVTMTIIVAVISMLMPRSYRSSAVLLPPSNEQSGVFSDMLSTSLSGLFSGAGGGDETNRIIAILKSRTVMEKIIKELNLIDIYNADNMEHALDILRDNILIDIGDEGTITISSSASTGWLDTNAEDIKVKYLAQSMTNLFILELDRLNKELNTKEAKYSREFIEKRYYKNIEDLTSVEEEYKKFLENNDMIILEEQTKAAILAAAQIKALIVENEVQLGVLSNTLNQDHPEIKRLKDEITQLQMQMNQMEFGKDNNAISHDLFPTLSNVPELGVQLGRLERNIEIQNTIFSFLTQQYEEAKIKEARDTPTIQVLDNANLPEKRYQPRRTIMVLLTFVFSAVIMSFIILLIEFSLFASK